MKLSKLIEEGYGIEDLTPKHTGTEILQACMDLLRRQKMTAREFAIWTGMVHRKRLTVDEATAIGAWRAMAKAEGHRPGIPNDARSKTGAAHGGRSRSRINREQARLLIIDNLTNVPRTMTTIGHEIGIRPETVSRHISVLIEEGIAKRDVRGVWAA